MFLNIYVCIYRFYVHVLHIECLYIWILCISIYNLYVSYILLNLRHICTISFTCLFVCAALYTKVLTIFSKFANCLLANSYDNNKNYTHYISTKLPPKTTQLILCCVLCAYKYSSSIVTYVYVVFNFPNTEHCCVLNLTVHIIQLLTFRFHTYYTYV